MLFIIIITQTAICVPFEHLMDFLTIKSPDL